jgi:hypothetical protein
MWSSLSVTPDKSLNAISNSYMFNTLLKMISKGGNWFLAHLGKGHMSF